MFHLDGSAVPLLPSGAVGVTGCAAPAPQHLADLTVEFGQLISQTLGGPEQSLGEPLYHLGIDAQIVVSGHSRNLTIGRPGHNSLEVPPAADDTLGAMTQATSPPLVELLTRDGCTICARVHARLAELAGELGFDLSTTDVAAAAQAGNPGLRAEFGDRLPVILLDGREHSYWEIDEARLRADLGR